jgi:hypothetical protein
MRSLVLALPLLALVGCGQITTPTTTTATGKTVLAASALGHDALAIANDINVGTDLYVAAAGAKANQQVVLTLNAASAAFYAYGTALTGSTAISGDMQANITLAVTNLEGLGAAVSAAFPAQAGAVTKFNAGMAVLVGLYNADALAAGMPVLPNVPLTFQAT